MNANIKGKEKYDGNAAGDPKLGEKFNSIMIKIISDSESLKKRMILLRFKFMEFLSIIYIFMIIVLFKIK